MSIKELFAKCRESLFFAKKKAGNPVKMLFVTIGGKKKEEREKRKWTGSERQDTRK
ncbi:MAG: hypothetical protein ACI9WT_000652 [Flavobacterium sp.]|jgi:hypothetical protein